MAKTGFLPSKGNLSQSNLGPRAASKAAAGVGSQNVAIPMARPTAPSPAPDIGSPKTAPPVYRPLPVNLAPAKGPLQLKKASPPPPVYRPKPSPIVQPKPAIQPGISGKSQSQPGPPPVYRPQPSPVAQPKPAIPLMNGKPGSPPPVYRPDPVSVRPPKMAVLANNGVPPLLQPAVGMNGLRRAAPSGATGGAWPPANGRIIQPRISFENIKTFRNIEELIHALKQLYAEEHHEQIETLVNAYEDAKWAIKAVQCFRSINATAAKQGWTRAVKTISKSGHGPQLPRLDVSRTKEDRESALSTFMFGSVTLARAELTLPTGEIVPFEERQESSKQHAEDLLISSINAFAKENGVDLSKCSLKITINNAPCGRGKGEKNCARTLANYARAKGFAYVRIYFMTNYGEQLVEAIGTLKSAKIKVSNFSPKQLDPSKKGLSKKTWGKIQAHERIDPKGVKLDPWSESEAESDEEGEDEEASLKRKRESSQKKPKKHLKKKVKVEIEDEELVEPEFDSISIDGLKYFGSFEPDLGRATVLNGYQVSSLLDLFDGEPDDKWVNIGGVEYKIKRLKGKGVRTDYNPDGVQLALVLSLRGG